MRLSRKRQPEPLAKWFRRALISEAIKSTAILWAVATCLCCTGVVQAAAPLNNNFNSSLTLLPQFLTNTVRANNQNADKEPLEPSHAGNLGGASVWWNWTAPVSANATFDTVGSSIDTLLAVYTGNAVSTLTNVASDD